jgi:hypothetical protein
MLGGMPAHGAAAGARPAGLAAGTAGALGHGLPASERGPGHLSSRGHRSPASRRWSGGRATPAAEHAGVTERLFFSGYFSFRFLMLGLGN